MLVRLHLVRHRTALKNRIHATLIAFGHPVPVSDLFGTKGRELLAGLAIPEPWARLREHLPTGRDPVPGAKVQIERMPSIDDARAKEARVIRRSQPPYNARGN